MEENENGTIQYWLEVQRIGSLLFQNIKSGDNSLKSLITSIIESPLLSDIECLSEDEASHSVSPFTSWLLGGLLKAAACHTLAHLKTFYTVAQLKILTSTYDRDLYAFEKLARSYVEFLDRVIKVQNFPMKFSFLLQNDYFLDKYNRTLSSVSFEISDFNEQVDLIISLVEVIKSILDLILNHCFEVHITLWRNLLVLLNSSYKSLNFMVLPLLSQILDSNKIIQNDDEINYIFQILPGMIKEPSLSENSAYQHSICEIWNSIKQKCSISSICSMQFFNDILRSHIFENKKCSVIKNFLINEFSHLLSETPNEQEIFTFLEDYTDIAFSDKLLLLLDSTANELKVFIEKQTWEENFTDEVQTNTIVNALDVSKIWNKILSAHSFLMENNDPGTSKVRLDSFNNLMKFCWKVLYKIDLKLDMSMRKNDIHFFGNIFSNVAEKIISDLNNVSLQCDKALQVAAEALSCLLNLPESQSHTVENNKYLDFIINPLKADTFNLPGFLSLPLNSVVPVLFLRCLQTIPAGAPVECIISILSRCASLGEYNKSLAIQAIKSTPFFFASTKTSPCQLISDILMPIALQENVELLSVLIDTIVNLICVLADTGYVIRNKDFELAFHCFKCSENEESISEEIQSNLSLVEPHLIKLICQISPQDPYVKKKLLNKLPRMAVHVTNLNSKDVLEKFLEFLSDDDKEVRQLLSNCITSIIFTKKESAAKRLDSVPERETETYPESRKPMNTATDESISALDLVFEKLEKFIHLSLRNNEFISLQNSLLETLIKIACYPDTRVLRKSIKLLLLFIGHPNVPVSAMLSEITAAHRTTPLLLYYDFRPELSHFLGNIIAINRIQYKHSLRSTVSEIAIVFKGLNESRFAMGSEIYIIPVLILWISRQRDIEDLLEEWSSLTGHSLPVILSRCFQNIYTYIVLNESEETFEKCMFCVERFTDLKLSELILHSQKLIINQLLFNYHRASDKVVKALKNVVGLNSDAGKEEVVENLEPRFVGYLLFIVSKFVKEINVDSEQVQAIHSLTAVITLMGKKFVTPVARKVLATLHTILTFNTEEHFKVQLNAWEVFVQTVEPNELGPLLATIVVSLIPFLEFFPLHVSRILNFLIVVNEEAVKDFLSSLIFIPNHALLAQVNSKLEKYILFEDENLKDKLSRETSLASHETVGVRVEGLKALQKTLKKFSIEIQDLIIGSDEIDPCIKTLLETLVPINGVICCSDSDQDISNLAAACLGQLGAVDPGLLPKKPKPKNNLPLSVHDPEFAFLALTEISRGFQNARNSVDMDAFAIAIQELLKMYHIGPNAENGIWNRFPIQIQNLMTPMLTSRYKVQTPKREVWPDILFGTKDANTFMGWASLWASRLIGFCKDDRAVYLFKICEPSLKRDINVLLFFLKYILLQAVIRDSSVHDIVMREMEAVITYDPQNVDEDDFRLNSRPIRLIDFCGYPNMKSTITFSETQSCAMTVFLLIDFVHSWLRIYRSVNCSSSGDHLQKRDYVIVKEFLEKIDYLRLSVANFEIKEYPRAIMYLEDVISKSGNITEYLPLLSKSYALYGDLDSVAGSSTFQKTSPKIEDLLLSHQVSGQLEEVRIIYEKLGKDGQLTPSSAEEMINCYLNLGEPYTALTFIKSLTNKQPDMMSLLSESMTESLIKLGDYSQLEKFLESEKFSEEATWYPHIGTLLLNIYKKDYNNVLNVLSSLRLQLANSLKQTGLQLSHYQQGYFCLVKLQVLNEIERVFEILNTPENQTDLIKQLVEEWTLRSAIVQADQRSLEPLLSMRRILLELMKKILPEENEKFLETEVAKCWVKSAEIARKAGCFHQAYNYVLNAEQYNIPLTFIEKAQLFWDKNDQDLCLFTLNRGIKEFFPDASEMKNWDSGEKLEERKMCAEAKLLYAIYSEKTSNCDHNTNMTNYQNAFEVCRQLEKSEVFLAQCLDRVVLHMDNNEQDERKVCELKVLMVHHFGKSLMYGCEYIYQTVPRMLSIWLDLGEKVDTEEKSLALAKLNKIIQGFVNSLPAFVFMTALPQLLSRLGHPNRKVFLMLKNILVVLLKAFPQQCLWAVQAVAKSSVSERVQRYNEFIQDSSLRASGLLKLIGDFTNLCDKLNKLTNRNLPQETAFRGLKVSSIVRELPPLLASEKFSAIIVPITRFCSISLPRKVTSSSHEAFPKQAVYITGIEDDVTVLQSLQRPRKISFRGSDGKLYEILCKPKDDLRRDGRLMEFNNIVNMYLRRDPESRLRGLHIRTYVVTPLGESGGLLEWVPNLIGLRQALVKLYKQFGKYTNAREIKTHECHVRDPLEKKRSVFVEKLLVLHPPLFPEWFRLTFPDPSGWYIARESYVRTTAVMSMVGYILGLGDRHGENILFDSESGDTVHVDFNCLFNKGEKFDWKERVPFRLTHNMVAAMGPFGVEGTFRKSCEISLRVLRSQSKTLMSVLTPFAYDPFGSWGKNKEIVQNERDQKIGEALQELRDIEQRLSGSLRVKQKQSTVYLSVEGQARSLIIEATDLDNLCQMYFGWGAYL